MVDDGSADMRANLSLTDEGRYTANEKPFF